jgi:hypothetical protein
MIQARLRGECTLEWVAISRPPQTGARAARRSTLRAPLRRTPGSLVWIAAGGDRPTSVMRSAAGTPASPFAVPSCHRSQEWQTGALRLLSGRMDSSASIDAHVELGCGSPARTATTRSEAEQRETRRMASETRTREAVYCVAQSTDSRNGGARVGDHHPASPGPSERARPPHQSGGLRADPARRRRSTAGACKHLGL